MQQDSLFMPMMGFVVCQTIADCEKQLLSFSDKEPNEETIFIENELSSKIETLNSLVPYLDSSQEQFLELMKHFDKATIDALYSAFTLAHVTIGTVKHHLTESKELLLR